MEWRNVTPGETPVYSVSDNSVLITSEPDRAGHSIVFLKAGTNAVEASALIEKLDTAGGSPDTAGWGGPDGLNLESRTLPYLVVKGNAAEVKDLLAKAGLVPKSIDLWSGIEGEASAGYTRKDNGHEPKGPRGLP